MSKSNSSLPVRGLVYGFALLLGTALGSPAVADTPAVPETHEVQIVVQGGYHPAQVTVRSGQLVRLQFLRKEYGSCSKEVVFPALGIRRELPPNVPVNIEFVPPGPGEYEFHCGMHMIRGKVLVSAPN